MSDEDDVVENEPGKSEEAMEEEGAAGSDEQDSSDDNESHDGQSDDSGDFHTPEMDEFSDDVGMSVADMDNPDLDVILDIPVQISMVVGTNQISIRNLLQLNQGSVIELDRLAGEPLDVLVNNTLVAHGEVVVINDKFGIRLTDVVSAAERIRNLN
jgi:flagellar motor switch protein FliN/FliY